MVNIYRLKRSLNRALIVMFWFVIPFNLTYGQYVSDEGIVNHELIVQEISELELYSVEQDELISVIVKKLSAAISEFSPEDYGKVTDPVVLKISRYRSVLRARIDFFAYLRKPPPVNEFEYLHERDTVSSEIRALIAKCQELRESMKTMESKLMEVVLDTNETRASKELAVSELAKNENLSVTEFIFRENKNLEFYDEVNNDLWSDVTGGCLACDRTGLWKLFLQSTGFNRKKLDRNWSALPFVIEYFDTNPNYESGTSIEKLNIWSLLIGYSHPWLISDFIYANMENKSSTGALMYKSMYESERKEYEQKSINND